MLGNAVPISIHVADFGQHAVDDDSHGGGDDVMVDRRRQSALDGDQQRGDDAGRIGKSIPHPQKGPVLMDALWV